MAPSHAAQGTQPHTCATSLAKRWASPTRKSLLCLALTLLDVFSRSEVALALLDTLMPLPPSTQRALALLDQRALQELAWQEALPGPRTGLHLTTATSASTRRPWQTVTSSGSLLMRPFTGTQLSSQPSTSMQQTRMPSSLIMPL